MKKSLMWKMLLSYVAVLLVAVVGLSVAAYSRTISILTEKAISYNTSILQLISERVDTYLEQLVQVGVFTQDAELQKLLTRAGAENPEEDAVQRMRRLLNFRDYYAQRLISLNFTGYIQDVYFVYPDGEVLHTGEGIPDMTVDFTSCSWYREAVAAAGREVIVDTHWQTYNVANRYPPSERYPENQQSLCFSVAKCVVEGNTGNVFGVLLMDVKLDEFSRILEPLLLGQKSEVYFVNDDGEILFAKDSQKIGKTLTGVSYEQLQAGEGNFILPKTATQEQQLITFLISAKTGWWLVNENEMADVISEAKDLRWYMVSFSLLALFLTILLSVFFANRIFSPVKVLTKAVGAVQKGDLSVRAPLPPTKDGDYDEIGRLTSAFNHMVERLQHLIEENYLMQIRQKDAQLGALQAQINPHFLYNTLESISCIAQVNEVEEISEISRALANMFRYNVDNKHKEVAVREEVEHLKNYLCIQSIRYGKKLRVHWDLQENALDCRMLRLVMQPLVENAISHGIEPCRRGGDVWIRVCTEEQMLLLTVEDNGVGIEKGQLEILNRQLSDTTQNSIEKDRHIGIANVNSRLVLYYGIGYGLTIESEKDVFTRVTVRLPREEKVP